MGFGSFLGSIMKGLPVVGPIAGAIGQVAGLAGGGAGAQRQDENDLIGQRNNQRAAMYNTAQGATSRAYENQSQEGLQRAQLGITSDRERARQSILGSLMKNLQTSQVSSSNPSLAGKIPSYSGGMQASAVLAPMTRQQGQGLMGKALSAQQTGSDVPAATNFLASVLTPPELEALKKSGLLEKILGGVGLGGSLISAAGAMSKPKPSSGPPPPMGAG
jgi:hypothetical protein